VKEFTRAPTGRERALAVVLNFVLVAIFGALTVFLASHGEVTAAVICALLTCVWIGLFFRAAFGSSKALGSGSSRLLAWVLLFVGLAGFVLVLFVPGSAIHRLMVLSGSITFFTAGLVGVRR
jgi:hypothetical protein